MRPTDQQSQPPSRPVIKDIIMERNEAPGRASVPQAQRNGDQQNRPPLQRSSSSNVAKKRPVSRELSLKIMENMRKRKMKTTVPSDDLCRTWHHQKGAHKCSECSHYSFSIKRLAEHFMLVHRKVLTSKRLKKCPKYDVHDPKRTCVKKKIDTGVPSLSTSKRNARTKSRLGVAVSTSAASTNSNNAKTGNRLGVGSSKSARESTLKTENKSRVSQDNRVPGYAHQRVPDIAIQVDDDDDDDVIEIPIVHTCRSKKPATTINMQTQANQHHTSSRHQSPERDSSSNVDMKPRITHEKSKDNLSSESSALPPPGFERHEIHESLQSVLGPDPSCSDTNDPESDQLDINDPESDQLDINDPESDQSDTGGLDPDWSDSEAMWSNQEKQKDHKEKTTQRLKEHATLDKTSYSSQVEEDHASLEDEARLISEAKSNIVTLLLKDQHYIFCNYCLQSFKSRRDLKRHRYYECTVQRKRRLPSSNREISKQDKKQKFMEKYREVFKDKEGIRLHPAKQTKTAACSSSGVRNEFENQAIKFGKGKKLQPRDMSKTSDNLCRKSFPKSTQNTTHNHKKYQEETSSKKVTTKNPIRAGQSSSLPSTSTGISSKSLHNKQLKFSTESNHNEMQYGDASNTTIQTVSSKKSLPFKKSSKQSRGMSEKKGITIKSPQEILSIEAQRNKEKMFKPPKVKNTSACEQDFQPALKGKKKSKDHQEHEPSTSREFNEKVGGNKSNSDLQSLQPSTCTKEKKIPRGHKPDRQVAPPSKVLNENLCKDKIKGPFAKGSSLSSTSSTTVSTSNKIAISGKNKAASKKMAHLPSQSKTTGVSAFEDFLVSRDRYTMKNAHKRRRSTEKEVTARKKSCIGTSTKNMPSTETNSNGKERMALPSHFQPANSSEGEYNLQETVLSPEAISHEQNNTDEEESPNSEAVLESYVPKQHSCKMSTKRSKSNDISFAMEKAPAKSQNTEVSSDITVKPQTSVSTSDKEIKSGNHIKKTPKKSSELQNSMTLSDSALTETSTLSEIAIPKSRIYSYLGSVVEQLNIPIADSQPSSVQNEDNQEVAENEEEQTEIGSFLNNFLEEAQTIQEEQQRHSLPHTQKVVKEPEKIGDHATVERKSAKSRAKHTSDKHLDDPQNPESNFKVDNIDLTPPSWENVMSYVDNSGITRITLARRPNSDEVKSSESHERQINAYDGSEHQDDSVVTEVRNESDGSHCLDERDSLISVEELEEEGNVEAELENQKVKSSGLLSGSEIDLSMKEQVKDGQSLPIKQKNLGSVNLESSNEVQNISEVDIALIEVDQSSAAAPISTEQPVTKVSGFNVKKAGAKFSSIMKRVNQPIHSSCTKLQNSDANGTNDLADSIKAQSIQNEVPSAQNKVTQAEDVPPEELDVSHELVIDLDTNMDKDLANNKQQSPSESTAKKISSGKNVREDITKSKQTKQINSQGVSGENNSTNCIAESNKTTTESSNYNTSTSESDNSFDNKNEELDNMAAAIEAAVSRTSENDPAEVEPQVDLETHTQLSREYLAGTLGPYLHNLKAACAQPSSGQRPQSSLQNSSRQADFERMRKLVAERKQRENQQKKIVKGTNDREAETSNSSNRSVMASKYSGSSQDSSSENVNSDNKTASEQEKTVYRCSVCCQEFDSLKARYSSQHACRYQDTQTKVIKRSKSDIKHPPKSIQPLPSNQSKLAHHRKDKHVRFDIPHAQRRHSVPSGQTRHREEYSRGNIIALGRHQSRQHASHRSQEERSSSRNSRHIDSTHLSQVFPLNKHSQRNENKKDGKSSRCKDAIVTSSSVKYPVSTQEPVGLISLPSPVAPRMATAKRSQNQNENLHKTQEPIGLISLPSPAPQRQSINRNQTDSSLLSVEEQCQLESAEINPSVNSKEQDKLDKVGNCDEKDMKSSEEKRKEQPNTGTNVPQETNQSITLEMTCEDESDLSRGLSANRCYLPPWINSNMSEIVASPRPPSRSEEADEVASTTKESSTETSTTQVHESHSSLTNVLSDDLCEKETHSDVSEISMVEISTPIATLPSSSSPQMTSDHSSSATQSSVSHSLRSQTVQKERNSSSTTDCEVQDDTSDSLDPEVLLAQLNEINSISSDNPEDLDGKIVTLAKKIMLNYKLMTTLQKKKKEQELDKLKASGNQSSERGQSNQSGQDAEKSNGSESQVSDIVGPNNNSVSVSRPNQNNDVQIIQSSSTARRRSFDDGGQKTVRARHNSAPNYTQVNRASVVPTTPRNIISDAPFERMPNVPDANSAAVNVTHHGNSNNCITGTTNSAVYNPSQALNSTLTVSSVISQQITATQSIFPGDTIQLQNQPESVMGSIQQSQHHRIQMQQNPSNVVMQENQNNFEWRQQVPRTGLENMILQQSQQQQTWLQQQEQLQQQLQQQQEAQRRQDIQQQLRELHHQQEQVQRQLQQYQCLQTQKQPMQQDQQKELQQTQRHLELRRLLQQRSERQLLHQMPHPQNQRQVVQFPQGQQQQQRAEHSNNWQRTVEPRLIEQSAQNQTQQSTGLGQNSPHFMQIRGQQQPREASQQQGQYLQMQPQLQQRQQQPRLQQQQLQQQQQRLNLENRQQNHQIQQKQQHFQQRQRQQHLHHHNQVQQHQQREHPLQQQHQQNQLLPRHGMHNQQHHEQLQTGNTKQMLHLLHQLGPNLEGNRQQLLEIQRIMEQNIGSLTPFHRHMLTCIREKLRTNQSNQEQVGTGRTSCQVQNQQSQHGLQLQARENTPNTPVFSGDQVMEFVIRHALTKMQNCGPRQSEGQISPSNQNLSDSNHLRDPSPLETSNAQVEQERENRSSVHSDQSDPPADHPSREPSPAQQGQVRTCLSGLDVCRRYFQQFDLKTQTPSVASEIARMKARYRQLEIQLKNVQTPAEKFTADLLVTILVKDLRILGLTVKRTPLEKQLQILSPSSTEANHIRLKINAISNLLMQGRQQKLKAQNLLASAVAKQVATTSVATAFNIKQEPREQAGPSSGRIIFRDARNHTISPTTSTPESPLLCNDSQSDSVAGNSNTLQIPTVPQNDHVSSENQCSIADKTPAQEGSESPTTSTTLSLDPLEDRYSENLTPVQHEESTAVNEYQKAINASNVFPLDVLCSSSSSQPTQEIEHPSGNSADVQGTETTATDAEHHTRTTSTDNHLTSNANKINNGSSSQAIPVRIRHLACDETPLQQNDPTTSTNDLIAAESSEQLISTDSQSDSSCPSSIVQGTTQPCNISVQKSVSPDIIHVASETPVVEHIAAKELQHHDPSTTQATSHIGYDSGPSTVQPGKQSTNDVSHSVVVSNDVHASSTSSYVPEKPTNASQHSSSESFQHQEPKISNIAPQSSLQSDISHKGPMDVEAIVNHPKKSPSTQTIDPVGTPRQHSVCNDHISSSDAQADTPHAQKSDHQANLSPNECGRITVASNHVQVISASEEHDANGNKEDSHSCASNVAQETPTNQLLRDTSYIQSQESSATTKKISNNPPSVQHVMFSTVENQGDTCRNVQVTEKEKTSDDTGSAISFSNLVAQETPTLDQSSDVTSVQLEKPVACAIQQIQTNISPSVQSETSPTVTSQEQSDINILASEEGGASDDKEFGAIDNKEGGSSDDKEGGATDDRGGASDDKEGRYSDDKEGGVSDDKEGGSIDDKEGGSSDDKEGGSSDDKEAGTSDDKEAGVSDDKEAGVSDEKEGDVICTDAGPQETLTCGQQSCEEPAVIISQQISTKNTPSSEIETFGGDHQARHESKNMPLESPTSGTESSLSLQEDSCLDICSQGNIDTRPSDLSTCMTGKVPSDTASEAESPQDQGEVVGGNISNTLDQEKSEQQQEKILVPFKGSSHPNDHSSCDDSSEQLQDLQSNQESHVSEVNKSSNGTEQGVNDMDSRSNAAVGEILSELQQIKNSDIVSAVGTAFPADELVACEKDGITTTTSPGTILSAESAVELRVSDSTEQKIQESGVTQDNIELLTKTNQSAEFSISKNRSDLPNLGSCSEANSSVKQKREEASILGREFPNLGSSSDSNSSEKRKREEACMLGRFPITSDTDVTSSQGAKQAIQVLSESTSDPCHSNASDHHGISASNHEIDIPKCNSNSNLPTDTDGSDPLTSQGMASVVDNEQKACASDPTSSKLHGPHPDLSSPRSEACVRQHLDSSQVGLPNINHTTREQHSAETEQTKDGEMQQSISLITTDMEGDDTNRLTTADAQPTIAARTSSITTASKVTQVKYKDQTKQSQTSSDGLVEMSGSDIEKSVSEAEGTQSLEKANHTERKQSDELETDTEVSDINQQTQSVASGDSIAEHQESPAEKSLEVKKAPEPQQHEVEACTSLISSQTQSVASGDSIEEHQESPAEKLPDVEKPPEPQQHEAEACTSVVSLQTQSVALGDCISGQQESPLEKSPVVEKPPEPKQHVAEVCSSRILPQTQSVTLGDAIAEEPESPAEKSPVVEKPPEPQQHVAEACSSHISPEAQGNTPDGTTAEQQQSTPELNVLPAEEQAKNEESTMVHQRVTGKTASAQEECGLSTSTLDPSFFTIPAGFQPLQSLPSSPQATENTEQDADLKNAQDQARGTPNCEAAAQQQEIISTEPVSPVPGQATTQQPDIIITESSPVQMEAQQTDVIITEPVSPTPVSAASELILSDVAIQPALPDMSTFSSLVAPVTLCSLSPVEVRPYRVQKRKADSEAEGPAMKKFLEGNASVLMQSCEKPTESANKKKIVNLTTVLENLVDNDLKPSGTSSIEVVDLTEDCDSDASSDLEIISLSPASNPGQSARASSSDKSDRSALPAARPKDANFGSRSGTANAYMSQTVKLQEVTPTSRTEQSASKSNQVSPKANSQGQTTMVERTSSNRLDQMAEKQSSYIPLLQSKPSACASQSLPQTVTSQTSTLISQPNPVLLQPKRTVQSIHSASNMTVVWDPNPWATRQTGSAKALKNPQQNYSNQKWSQQILQPIPNSNAYQGAASNRKSPCNPTVLNSSMSSSQTQRSSGHPISLSARKPEQVPLPKSASTTTAIQRPLHPNPRQRVAELQSSHNTASRQGASHSRSPQQSMIWVPNSLSSPASSMQTSAASTSHHSTNASRTSSATETRPVAEVTPQIQANRVQPKPQDAVLPVIISVQSLNPDVWKSSKDNQKT